MLKKLFLLMILSTFATAAFSQILVGVKGGLNYVNFFGPANEDNSIENRTYRAGYHFGFFGNLQIMERFSARPELLFSNKGYKTEMSSGKESLHLNYLNLPVFLAYEPIAGLKLMAGPEFGYLLSAKYKTDSITFNAVEEKWVNKSDVGIALGILFNFTDKAGMGVRYTHGLVYPLDNYGRFTEIFSSPLDDNIYRNRAFQISLTYQLLKKEVKEK